MESGEVVDGVEASFVFVKPFQPHLVPKYRQELIKGFAEILFLIKGSSLFHFFTWNIKTICPDLLLHFQFTDKIVGRPYH